jgi:quinol-cytochrome oxidoreductase complex cytochrome b subunit
MRPSVRVDRVHDARRVGRLADPLHAFDRASAFFVVVYLHAQGFYGSYRKPRELHRLFIYRLDG